MLFDSWGGILRVLLVGTAAYVALVVILRSSGKRTLSKLNAFDLVVTVAIGSTLATVLLSRSVALVEGILALALLVFLQYAIAWISVRSSTFSRLIKSDPTLLAHNGSFLDRNLREERVTREEVEAALRGQGLRDIGQTTCVVLESDGSISVVPR